jgi:type IV secretory pathway protease TraF
MKRAVIATLLSFYATIGSAIEPASASAAIPQAVCNPSDFGPVGTPVENR